MCGISTVTIYIQKIFLSGRNGADSSYDNENQYGATYCRDKFIEVTRGLEMSRMMALTVLFLHKVFKNFVRVYLLRATPLWDDQIRESLRLSIFHLPTCFWDEYAFAD